MRPALLAALLLAALAAPGSAAPIEKSPNVKLVANLPFTGGTELAWEGRYLFAAELDGTTYRSQEAGKGGVHIIDLGRGKPKEVGFLDCPGNDNDVAMAGPGVLAVGHHTNICNPGVEGMFLVDVRRPSRPRLLGSVAAPSSHTITPYPGKPFVYISPGGLANGGGAETIVDVSNPKKPKVAATFTPSRIGCHDLTFHVYKERTLAFCAGEAEVQIWDVTDPKAPSTISRIYNPAIQFGHYALASPDGDLLVLDDEAFAAHECRSGQSPTGSLWFYDISIPEVPLPVGKYARGKGAEPTGNEVQSTPSWCTSHHYNFVPGTRNLVTSWFSGGTTVLDLTDPTTPELLAEFRPEDTIAYTSHWYDGRIYVNDMARGVDVLSVKGLRSRKVR